MEQAVPGRPVTAGRDPFAVDEDSALEALALRWADAYSDISHGDDGRWTAVSRDDEHRTLTGETPDELAAAMRADWAREGTL